MPTCNKKLVSTTYNIPFANNYGVKRCIGCVFPMIVLRCLVSAVSRNGLVNMSVTIWLVGIYRSLIVHFYTWSFKKCYFMPMCLVSR
jgi:hypothetical protein